MDNCEEKTVIVKILLFAKAREIAGLGEQQLIVPKNILPAELKKRIIKEFQLESIKDNFILAVNEEFIENNDKLNLSQKDTIAVIPPLSGG